MRSLPQSLDEVLYGLHTSVVMPEPKEEPPPPDGAMVDPRARPKVLSHRGGVVRIDIHDEMYMLERAEFRQQIISAHPDKSGGKNEDFIRAVARFKRWEEVQKKWYETHGLLPPDMEILGDGSRPNVTAVRPNVRHGYRKASIARIETLMLDGYSRTAQEIAVIAGCSKGHVHVVLYRLAQRGAEIITIDKHGRRELRTYRLIAAARTPYGNSRTARVLQILLDKRVHHVEEFEYPPSVVNSAVLRLRGRGFTVVTVRTRTGTSYQLQNM